MSEFGQAFRSARLSRLKDVSDVAKSSKLDEKLICGIEDGSITPMRGTAFRMIEGMELHIGSPLRVHLLAIAETIDGSELTEPSDNSTDNADSVSHPQHYNNHPSGVECIQITEHMGFNLGNAIKYIWRADEKGNDITDLKKAAWYIQREIERRESSS